MAEHDASILAFARRMTARRIAEVERQLGRARLDRSPDAVHDLRVAARRLQYLLDCFHQLLDSPDTRRLRKRTKAMLAAGRSVRDRDIALEMAAEADLEPSSELIVALKRQRDAAADSLRRQVERDRYDRFADRWLERLGLGRG